MKKTLLLMTAISLGTISQALAEKCLNEKRAAMKECQPSFIRGLRIRF